MSRPLPPLADPVSPDELRRRGISEDEAIGLVAKRRAVGCVWYGRVWLERTSLNTPELGAAS